MLGFVGLTYSMYLIRRTLYLNVILKSSFLFIRERQTEALMVLCKDIYLTIFTIC